MGAGQYDLIILQGSDLTTKFTMKQDGVVVDLSGYSAKLYIKDKIGDTANLAEYTTVNTKLVITGIAGTVQLAVSSTDTAAITWTKGVYDLLLISASGVKSRPLMGRVEVSKQVSS